MVEPLVTRVLLRLGALVTLAFLYFPLAVIGLYAFNGQVVQRWPIAEWSAEWFSVAWENDGVRTALKNSVVVGLMATVIALVLGTLASMAIARYRSIPFGEVVMAGDSLAGREWQHRGWTTAKSARRQLFDSAADAALALTR